MFTNAWGHPLDPTGQPILPTPPQPGTTASQHLTEAAARAGIAPHTYTPPTGERLDRNGFHLMEADPPDTPDGDLTDHANEPPPAITGQHPRPAPPNPASPTRDTPIDPTRAGPDAA